MAGQLAQVNPGDLIRAEDYNQLVAGVNDLRVRVERLEAADSGGDDGIIGAPIIDTVNPIAPHIGDTVVVTGSLFDYTIGASRAALDGLPVTLLGGSSDKVLIFQVPALAGIPDGGRPVEFMISNLRLSTTRSLLVLPEPPLLQGSVGIEFEDTQPARVTPGQPCVFHFKLLSDANLPVTFTLTPTVSVPAWQAGLQILDEGGSVAQNSQVKVGALLQKDFFVRVAQITSAATTFTLSVTGQAAGIVASSGPQGFTVGEIGAQDADIQLTIDGADRERDNLGHAVSGTTVTLKTNERAQLNLVAKFHRTAVFDWSANIEPTDPPVWTMTTGALPPNYDIKADDIRKSGPDVGWAVEQVPVTVQAPVHAKSANLTFTLQREGVPIKRSLTLGLVAET